MASSVTLSSDVKDFLQKLSEQNAFKGHDVSIFQSSAQYAEESRVWGAQRTLNPEVILRPVNTEQIRVLTELLYDSPLDFAIRNGGAGSASAQHILVSLANLNKVSFDEKSETTTVDAGALWADVDNYMARKAPGWCVVCSRTPFVGVAGIVVIGGLSWLSHEFGLVSDPQNLLDVQIALADGRLIWASEDPDLLWAMRGGRCAFGIMTQFKFRARRLKVDGVYSAVAKYPLSKLEDVSRAVSKHTADNHDPKVAFHAFFMNPGSPFFPSEPAVGLILFDRHGPAHAESAEGYKWAFDIEGGDIQGGSTDLYSVNAQTDYARSFMGKWITFDATGLIDFDAVDDQFLVRGKAWFDKVLAADPAFEAGTYFIFEGCQKLAYSSVQPQDTAWPHGKHKHVLQLGVGYAPEHDHLRDLALELLADAFRTIPKTPLGRGDFTPTFYEPSVMDAKQIYGPSYEVLAKVADKYDHRRRFRSLFNPDPNFR